MKDRRGHEYADLVEIQKDHLTMWSTRLRKELFNAVAEYVIARRIEASDPEQKHQVFRGQDLIQIIMDWPNLNPVYPPIKDDASSLI